MQSLSKEFSNKRKLMIDKVYSLIKRLTIKVRSEGSFGGSCWNGKTSERDISKREDKLQLAEQGNIPETHILLFLHFYCRADINLI